MTGRLIFSLIVIAIVLVVVTVFFVLLFKLICCNRRRNKHNKKMVKKLQQQQQLLQQQQQQQRLRQQYNLNKLSYFDEESNGNSHKYADINGNIPSYLNNNNNNNRRHYPFNNANYQYFNQPNCEYYQYPKLYYSQHKYKQQNQLQHSSCGNEQKSKKTLAEHIYEFDDPELLNDEVDGKDTSTTDTLKNDSLPNGNNIQIASDENEINNSNNNKSTICNNNESEENKKGTKRKASFFSPFNWFRKSDSSFNKNNNCKSNDKSKRPLRVMENGYLNKKARKKMNKKHLKNKKKQKLYEKTLDRYYVIDSSRNGNIYYLFNPMSQSRRLSVIAEEKTSTLSSRSNSTDKTHSIV